MIKELVGQEIRKLRNSQGYSQEKFATLCGIDRTYLAGVEAGKRNISLENLEKISKGLNITLSELFAFGTPVQRTIILDVNGEKFILESDRELTRDVKNHIEAICSTTYDEESDFNVVLKREDEDNDIYEASDYDIARAFQEIVKEDLGINVNFQRIDLEVSIRE